MTKVSDMFKPEMVNAEINFGNGEREPQWRKLHIVKYELLREYKDMLMKEDISLYIYVQLIFKLFIC